MTAPPPAAAPAEADRVPVRGMLFSQMQPPPELEAEFHDWYETEHIPARLALPGFREAVRYRAVEGELDGVGSYLACYLLDDMAELVSPAYQRLKSDPGERTTRMLAAVSGFTRYFADEISDTGPSAAPATLLSVVAFDVPDDAVPPFEQWYAHEHVPMLMQADGWLRVRRYAVRPGGDGPPWTRLALHELADASAMDSPERAAARDTPQRAALASAEWFSRSGRWLYEPISHATSGPGADSAAPDSTTTDSAVTGA